MHHSSPIHNSPSSCNVAPPLDVNLNEENLNEDEPFFQTPPPPQPNYHLGLPSPSSSVIDANAISRVLQLGNLDVSSFFPTSTPITVEIPFLGIRVSRSGTTAPLEPCQDIPPFKLSPACGQPQPSSSTEQNNKPSETDPLSEPCISNPPEPVSLLPHLQHPFTTLDPAVLHKKKPKQVRLLLSADNQSIVSKINQYWQENPIFQSLADQVSVQLNGRAIKLQRRKRMGAEVPPSEKKAIRAQRNRERSQALRKYHKNRMINLEEADRALTVYNSATRSLINCLLEEAPCLQLIETYFEGPNCSEQVIAFLRHTM